MPEYLAPGVYVEEVSFRSKSIEGVPTSTTGFAGMTRYGPVRYDGGPSSCEPRLITSFTEFESVYGGLRILHAPTIAGERLSYVAHAARAFFMNGGTRLYISRVFAPRVADLGWCRLDVDRRERHHGDLESPLAGRTGQRLGESAGAAQQERGDLRPCQVRWGRAGYWRQARVDRGDRIGGTRRPTVTIR